MAIGLFIKEPVSILFKIWYLFFAVSDLFWLKIYDSPEFHHAKAVLKDRVPKGFSAYETI